MESSAMSDQPIYRSAPSRLNPQLWSNLTTLAFSARCDPRQHGVADIRRPYDLGLASRAYGLGLNCGHGRLAWKFNPLLAASPVAAVITRSWRFTHTVPQRRSACHLLLLATVALNDHKLAPSIAVSRLLASPSEVRLGNFRVSGARIRVLAIDRHRLFERIDH
jgi:hypothetical protein